jgi:hypothetical protein
LDFAKELPEDAESFTTTFLKVYMELGSYFLFLQEQIKDIIIITECLSRASSPFQRPLMTVGHRKSSRDCVRYVSSENIF